MIRPMTAGPTHIAPVPAGESRLNGAVAIAVALLSCLMGLCDLQAGHLNHAMQRLQAEVNDHWAFYQARNLREEVARAALAQIRLQAAGLPERERGAHDEAIAAYEGTAARQAEQKQRVRQQAEAAQQRYAGLSARSEHFYRAEASLSIAIALLAITALTQRRWLFGVAMLASLLGVGWGAAGVLG